MAVVGSAQVLIRPTFSGMQKDINRELQGVGEEAGKTGGSRLGGALKTWGKRGAIAAGAAIAAVAGTALVKGFGRLTAIENAEAKLRGLGHSADEVAAIMDNALQSVLGTSYGMDEAATTAAGAVAAGVKPGEDLERVLGLVADAATIAGTDMGEMGSIFNKIATGNRVTMQEVNQLSDRGLPIMQMLADQYGVTAEEARDMVSRGEVDFAAFSTAIEDNLAGAALESGNTTEGAFKNMGAALGRVGANMLSGIFPKFKEGFMGITEWLGPIEEKAQEVGEALGEWLGRAAEAVGNFIQEFKDGEGAGGAFRDVLETVWGVLQGTFNFVKDTVIPALQDMAGWVKENQAWLLPLTAALLAAGAAIKGILVVNALVAAFKAWRAGTLAQTIAQLKLNIALIANPIGIVVIAIAALVAAFVVAWKNSETFRNVVTAAWEGIKTAASAVWDWMKSTFESIKDAIASVGQWFTDRGQDMQDAWNAVKDALGRGWEWIKKNVFDRVTAGLDTIKKWFSDSGRDIRASWDSVKNALKAGFDFIKRWTFDPMVAGFGKVRDFFQRGVDNIKDSWNSLKNAFRAVWDWINDNVFKRFRRGVENIAGWVGDAVDGIDRAWRNIANKFRNPINWVINTVWNDGIAGVFNNVASAIGISTRLPQNASIPRFAEGGRHSGGWALVGEEGPELVNFSNPGRVYTAAETAAALAQGRDLTREQSRAAAGRSPGEALAPMGGNWLSRAWDSVTGWVRGGLAAAANAILSPLTSRIASTMGQWGSTGVLFGDAMTSAVDSLVEWIRGKDDEGPSLTSRGDWQRPSAGPITSRYGPRWGGFHAGIDIAGNNPVFAAAAGQVYRTGGGILGGRTGQGIGIDHGGGIFTYYGHNPYGGIRVSPGQSVTKGQRIGHQGATGNVTGIHTHFELHRGGWGRAINPETLGVFDKGGMLRAGHMAMNLGRTPEAVLTGSQWKDISTLAARGSSGPAEFHLYDSDNVLMGTIRGEAIATTSAGMSDSTRHGRMVMG